MCISSFTHFLRVTTQAKVGTSKDKQGTSIGAGSCVIEYVKCFWETKRDLGPDHVQLTKVNWSLKVNWKYF